MIGFVTECGGGEGDVASGSFSGLISGFSGFSVSGVTPGRAKGSSSLEAPLPLAGFEPASDDMILNFLTIG